MASDSNTQLATQQSIKAFVEAQVTAEDLDITNQNQKIIGNNKYTRSEQERAEQERIRKEEIKARNEALVQEAKDLGIKLPKKIKPSEIQKLDKEFKARLNRAKTSARKILADRPGMKKYRKTQQKAKAIDTGSKN